MTNTKSNKTEDFALFILAHCNLNDIEINHFKLQKLLYYIQAWHMVYFDKKLIFDEKPQAWVNGPVYRSVYNKLKGFNAASELEFIDKDSLHKNFEETKKELKLDKEQWKFLYEILEHYGIMSHERLIMSTHRELPWNEARQELEPFAYSTREISLDTMYNYYKNKIEQKRAAQKTNVDVAVRAEKKTE